MKTHSLIALLMLGFCLQSFGQTREMLVGSWAFDQIAEEQPNELNELQVFYINKMMENFVWQLDENGRYRIAMNPGEESYGDWRVNDEMTQIFDTPDVGEPSTNKIYSLTAQEITLDVNGVSIVLVRTEEKKPIPQETKLAGVSATQEQLIGKWSVVEMRKADGSQVDGMSNAEASFDFRADGTYTYLVYSVKAEGSWTLDEEKGLIRAVIEEKVITYIIRSLSESDMQLQRGPNGGLISLKAQE